VLGCLKFESEILRKVPTHTPPSSSRKRGPIHTVRNEAKGIGDSRNPTYKIITTVVMGPRLREDDSGVRGDVRVKPGNDEH
jgi:hypothetical protein